MKTQEIKAHILGSGITSAVIVGMNAPTYAFAEGGIAAILPNMHEFIPMLVAFIILWIVLAKFGWPIFENMFEKRASTIRDDLQHAEDARAESQRLLEEYKQQLDEAKLEAANIVANAKQAGENIKADLKKQAEQESAAMIEKAQAAIETEKKAAVADLQSSVADLSISIASKLIGSDLDDKEHRAIIERYVKEAGSFNDGE